MSYRLIDNETNEDIIDKLGRIKDERDKYKQVLDKIKEKTIQFKDDLKMNEKIAKEQKRSNNISIQLVGLRVNAILELLEEIE